MKCASVNFPVLNMNEIPEALNFTGRGPGAINAGHMLQTVRDFPTLHLYIVNTFFLSM